MRQYILFALTLLCACALAVEHPGPISDECTCAGSYDLQLNGYWCNPWENRESWCYCEGNCPQVDDTGRCYNCENLPTKLDISKQCQAQFTNENTIFMRDTVREISRANKNCYWLAAAEALFLNGGNIDVGKCNNGFEHAIKQCQTRNLLVCEGHVELRVLSNGEQIGTAKGTIPFCAPQECHQEMKTDVFHQPFIYAIETFIDQTLPYDAEVTSVSTSCDPPDQETRITALEYDIAQLKWTVDGMLWAISELLAPEMCKFVPGQSCCGENLECADGMHNVIRLSPPGAHFDCFSCQAKCNPGTCCSHNKHTGECFMVAKVLPSPTKNVNISAVYVNYEAGLNMGEKAAELKAKTP